MLVNTHLFCTEAATFKKSDKREEYVPYPEGTYSYNEYWIEQRKRCIEGYSVGGVRIPGPYYYYLNFFPILLKDSLTKRKTRGFPTFTDVDLEYFNIVERARKEGKGIIFVKPRRRGFSFKAASLAGHEYTFFRDSKVIISAYDRTYSANTMGMTLSGLNFLNKNTAFGKQRNPDTNDHIKARYKVNLDGKEVWKGSDCEITCVTFGASEFASAGKSASLFIFDEAGIFPSIIESYNNSEYTWKDGDDVVGLPLVFGSSGSMEKGSQYFEEMFYNPEKYNLLAFDNIWDEGKQGTKCGWFPKASRMRFGTYKDVTGKYPEYDGKPMVDKEGNSIEFLGEQSVMDFRASKKRGSNERAYRDAVTQEPMSPAEAFLRTKNIVFPDIDLRERLAQIETDQKFLDGSYKAELVLLEGDVVELRPSDRNPIRSFPLKPEEIDSIQGIPELFEKPIRGEDGKIPGDRYMIALDPIDDDSNSNVENSLQCAIIFDYYTDKIVGMYLGRTKNVKTFYENVRRLGIYYNAEITYENNKKGFFGYMDGMNCVWMLSDVPQHLKDADMIKSDTYGNKSKGCPMNTVGMIAYGERLTNSYLLSQAHGRENGINNCYSLPSVRLIRELLAYDRDTNTDSVSALFICMIQREQKLKYFRNKAISANIPSFMNDPFFQRGEAKKKNKALDILFDKKEFTVKDLFGLTT